MADRPAQDRDLNLPVLNVNGRYYTAYDPNIALDIIERIAEGELLSDITKPNIEPRTVARSTFLRWVTLYPELAKAYAAAQRISALAFEEMAIAKAREIAKEPGTPARVSAYNTYISQLRWSAARRDPTKYSDKGDTKVVVPISINTNLDLGPGVTKGDVEVPDIYTIKIDARPPVDAEFTEVAQGETETEAETDLAELVPKTTERPKLVQELKKSKFHPHTRKRVLTPRKPK
jgi:hypothetical protein